jgi:hypothetical protein
MHQPRPPCSDRCPFAASCHWFNHPFVGTASYPCPYLCWAALTCSSEHGQNPRVHGGASAKIRPCDDVTARSASVRRWARPLPLPDGVVMNSTRELVSV